MYISSTNQSANIQTTNSEYKQQVDEMKSGIAQRLKDVDFSTLRDRQDIRAHLSLAVTF